MRKLDEADVRAQPARLTGIDALAVSLINSFADPAHERRIAEIAAELLPGVPVSLSSDVLPDGVVREIITGSRFGTAQRCEIRS